MLGIFNLPANFQLLTLAESLTSNDETTYGFGGGIRLTVSGNSLVQVNVQKSAGRIENERPKINTALTLQIGF